MMGWRMWYDLGIVFYGYLFLTLMTSSVGHPIVGAYLWMNRSSLGKVQDKTPATVIRLCVIEYREALPPQFKILLIYIINPPFLPSGRDNIARVYWRSSSSSLLYSFYTNNNCPASRPASGAIHSNYTSNYTNTRVRLLWCYRDQVGRSVGLLSAPSSTSARQRRRRRWFVWHEWRWRRIRFRSQPPVDYCRDWVEKSCYYRFKSQQATCHLQKTTSEWEERLELRHRGCDCCCCCMRWIDC